jgi:hypothetical protein
MCLTKIKDSDGTLGFWFTQSLGANTFKVRMDEGNSGKVVAKVSNDGWPGVSGYILRDFVYPPSNVL